MRARLRAGDAVTSRPNSSTEPAVGGNSPEIRLNSVVLPAPFGPRMARRSPGLTSRSTSLTAWTPPKRRPTPRKRRIGSAASGDVTGAATDRYLPKLTFSDLPTHGGGESLLTHFGLLRSGADDSGVKTPANVCSTSGIRRAVCTSGLPSPLASLTIFLR